VQYYSIKLNGQYKISGTNSYLKVAQKIFEFANNHSLIIFLNGPMGVGKTTFINHFSRLIGRIPTASASYGIVNISNTSPRLINCDFYRGGWSETFFEEEIYPLLKHQFYLFLEWVDPVPIHASALHVSINLQLNANNDRIVRIRSF
jgi:tRNA A37 threonylcarbamoyladenosine biosynthesis protein TsaE